MQTIRRGGSATTLLAALALALALPVGGCGCGDGGPTVVDPPPVSKVEIAPTSQAGIAGLAGVGETLGPSVLRRAPEIVTVLHFDLADAPAAFTSAWLEVRLHALDPEPPDGAVEAYVFAGDGEASLDEKGLGESLGTYGVDPGELPVLRIALTDPARAFLEARHPYLSLRLRTAVGEERYDVGAAGDVGDPTLTFLE